MIRFVALMFSRQTMLLFCFLYLVQEITFGQASEMRMFMTNQEHSSRRRDANVASPSELNQQQQPSQTQQLPPSQTQQQQWSGQAQQGQGLDQAGVSPSNLQTLTGNLNGMQAQPLISPVFPAGAGTQLQGGETGGYDVLGVLRNMYNKFAPQIKALIASRLAGLGGTSSNGLPSPINIPLQNNIQQPTF